MADYWTHNLDPVALHLVGPLAIRWYGLAYLVGLAWGWWLTIRWCRAGRVPLAPAQVGDFVMAVGLGMIIGGRLGYCLVYGWQHVLADPLYVVKLWEGGMASHGGIIGMALGVWWYARKQVVSPVVLMDLVAATAPMGIALGRMANFINGELWGKPATVPWAVIFPDAPPVEGVNLPRHPSQLYEMTGEGFLLLAIALVVHARHRRPGLTTGVVLTCYALARIVCEVWREPDVGHRIFDGLINKGQLLSLPILALSLPLCWWAWRRGSRPADYQHAVSVAAPG